MGLLNPAGLAWLALAAPLILLYFLRLRRREVTVSSLLFWDRVVDDRQANAPFQKLRRNLLLYLQLLVLALLAVAAARPYRELPGPGGSTVVFILDASASMAARERGGSRFQQARRQIAASLGRLGRGDRAMLLAATDRAVVLAPLSTDRRAQLAALAAARPTDLPGDLRDALRLAVAIARTAPDGRVYLYSDGAGAPLAELEIPLNGVEFRRVGEPVDNVGLTALDTRPTLDGSGRVELLVGLTASGPTPGPRPIELEFRAGGRLFDIRRLTVEPGRPTVLMLRELPGADGLLEVRLTGEDALAADNVARVALGGRARSEVYLVGQPDLFLERALTLETGWRPVKIDPATLVARVASNPPAGAVAIYCGRAPANEIPLPALWLNCASPGAPVEVTGTLDRPTLADWSPSHPVTRQLDLEHVALARALACRPQPWARVVATAEAPLIVVGEQAGWRRIYIGFDFLDSDLPLRPAFPMLVANALTWLSGGAAEAAWTARCGEPVTLPVSGETVRIEGPDQTTVTLPASRGSAVFAATDRVGRYRWTAAGQSGEIAVNLLSAAESDLTPRTELRFGRQRLAAPRDETGRPVEQWRWAILAAMVALLGEWWWFHRRG